MRHSVGEFDESLTGDEDWDWHLRIARKHPVGVFAAPCVLFRQRPPGSFDSLQLTRVRYTRRVFARHALPAWRRWASPLALVHAYNGAVGHYCGYFVRAAASRAERGERREALRSIARAFRILPAHTVLNVLRPTPLRRALLSVFRLRPLRERVLP